MLLFMGLGRMGLPMAQHVARSGVDIEGYDVSPERRVLFEKSGGRAIADLPTAFRQADAIMIMTGSQTQVDDLIRGKDGILAHARPETLILVISTVSPEFVGEMARVMETKNLRLVDAPVCRAEKGAVAGNLLAFLAGEKDACDQAAVWMRPFCADVEIVGVQPGAAQIAKTINNMILWASVLANEEGFRLAEKWQLDVPSLQRALITSSADNWSLRNWGRLSEMRWSIKDMEIAMETSKEAGIELPLGQKVAELVRVVPTLSHAKVD